jgi:hypothetical protein
MQPRPEPKTDDAAVPAVPGDDPDASVAGEEDPGAALDSLDDAPCFTEQSNRRAGRRMPPGGKR